MELRRIVRGAMGPMRLMGLMGIMSLMGLMGCSEDQEAEVRRQTVELMPCSPMFVEEQEQGVTRAWTPPTDYYLYTHEYLNGQFIAQWNLTYKSIECFFTKDTEAPKKGTFFYNDQYEEGKKWRLSMEITEESPFYVYGYIPSEVVDTASITDKNGGNAKYSEGAVLTLKGIQSVTPSDVCVVVGAKEGSSAESDATTDANNVTKRLQPGSFLVTAYKSTKEGEGDGKNYIYLLFDHLYSALRFNFTVGKEYDALRTIRLRKLEMQAFADKDRSPMKSKYDATITLTAGVATPTVELEPNKGSGDATYVTLFDERVLDDGDGMEEEDEKIILKHGELTRFLGCFVPGETLYFSLRTTYDVYDKKDNLIRQGCVAENYIDLYNSDKIHVDHVERGHIYSLTLMVEPTYLYVLSDPDVDNPTITIN